MQKAIEIVHNDKTLRGMEHIPNNGESNPAVILFHGYTGQKVEPHRFFVNISRELEKQGVASFRFDFYGSGESDGSFKDMTVLSELEDARAILDFVKSHPTVNESKVIVLGFSMGGLVASLLAGEREEDIHKLILIAPAGTLKDSMKDWLSQLPYIESLQAYDNGGNLTGQRFLEELQTIEVWEQSAKYNNKVLMIHGTDDGAVALDVASQYIEKCYGNQAELHVIEGADHTFNRFDWEQDVIRSIENFVSEA